MDKDKLSKDDNIGSLVLDLQEVQASGQVSRWYPLTYKTKPAGELLLESSFQSDSSKYMETEQTGFTQPGFYQREEEMFTGANPVTTIAEETVVASTETGALGQFSGSHEGTQIFTEQRQVVEPRTFLKEVDSVEMRPVLKEIEVLEPHKVVKDVLVTEAVPVKKEIQVTEPQVVKKEVEVIEPRLVTKQIQVVENVPVMKEVEVIEPVTITKEVETFEPQTFTKQVEVTENVPVMKQVTVTEPVTVKKAVEYEEPIITTQTITKKVEQPVVVDEKITTTVGPATVVGVETEMREGVYVNKVNDVRVSEEKRVFEQEKMLNGNKVEGYSSTTYETNFGDKINKHSNNYY